MSTQSSIFGKAFVDAIRQAVREEIQAAGNGRKDSGLLSPDDSQANSKFQSPGSTSRVVKIRSQHRIGRYIRFDPDEVLESQRLSVK